VCWLNNGEKRLLSQMSHNTHESPYPGRFLVEKWVLSSACWLSPSHSRGVGTSRLFVKTSYLLNRLFLDTMRRKPVGSVTELSLLLSSSNCWSNKSPASLSVSLLEHPLKEKERESERHVRLLKCWQEKALEQSRQYPDLHRFSADKSTTHTPDLPETHIVHPTHTWPNFPGSVQHSDGKQS